MAQYTGSGLIVTFKGTEVSTRFRSLNTKEEIDLVDQSAGSDTAKTYLTALEDGDAKLEVVDVRDGTAPTALWNLCDKGAEGTLQWQPEGTATGKPKHYVNAIVKSREKEHPYDDIVKATITFQFSGALTDTTN
jgi:hypothetical protein